MKVNLNQLEVPKASAGAAQALEIVNQPEPDLRRLEEAIMLDPVLAGTLLRYANSPIMRRSAEVNSVPSALRLLGLNSVRSAVVAATIRSMLPEDSPASQVILDHMLTISMLCKLIAQQVCPADVDELEFLGLVHDVGFLTLLSNFYQTFSALFERALKAQIEIDDLERAEFGISHNVVSARTAQLFRLPKLHIELLQDFHSRQGLREIRNEKERDTAILALAHLLTYATAKTPSFKESVPESQQELAALLSLETSQLEALLDAAAQLATPS